MGKKYDFDLYMYQAVIVKVYDGDTVRADIDLGFGTILKNQALRLWGIDAPEVRGESRAEGLNSKTWLAGRILNMEVIIKTHKDKKGKYGRWLAEIYQGGENINQWMIGEGHALEYGKRSK